MKRVRTRESAVAVADVVVDLLEVMSGLANVPSSFLSFTLTRPLLKKSLGCFLSSIRASSFRCLQLSAISMTFGFEIAGRWKAFVEKREQLEGFSIFLSFFPLVWSAYLAFC